MLRLNTNVNFLTNTIQKAGIKDYSFCNFLILLNIFCYYITDDRFLTVLLGDIHCFDSVIYKFKHAKAKHG